EAEIAGDGLLEGEEIDAAPFEIEIHPIDLVVTFDDFVCEALVLRRERFEPHSEAFEHDLAHVEDVLAETVELLLIAFAGHVAPSDPPPNVPFAEITVYTPVDDRFRMNNDLNIGLCTATGTKRSICGN